MVVWIKNLSDLPEKSIIAIRNFSEYDFHVSKKYLPTASLLLTVWELNCWIKKTALLLC